MAKRIAILHYAAPPTVGGVESTIYHHSRLLAAEGYEVSIITGRGIKFNEDVDMHLVPEMNSRHQEVLKVGKKLSAGIVGQDFQTLRGKLIDNMRPLLEETDISIVHNVLTLHKNLSLTAALRQLVDENVIQVIAWCHDFAWQDSLYKSQLHSGYPWDLLRQKWPGVQYVAVSDHRRERLAKLFGISPEEVTVITPGIAVADFLKLGPLTRAIIEQLDLMKAEPVLLLPARITRRKNIEFAIRVVAEVKRELPAVVLIVTGPPGPHNPANVAYLESLVDLKAKLGLKQNVHFLYELGQKGKPLNLPDDVIADLYRIADILLFPSQREGFGIPVLEAGIARTAVFAADIPSMRESSQGHAHLFDPTGDPAGVGQAIVSFTRSDHTYLLRRETLARYSWESILRYKLIPIIEKSSGPDVH